jgi:biotin transporter BioY
VDGKIAIILFSTLLPAFVVGYVLRTNGKTINFAVIGATLVYVASVVLIFLSFYLASMMNMRGDDLVLVLPFIVAALFYFLLKGSRHGNEP